MTCMRYIELNPVRANMVVHPRQYKWSSYLTNAEDNHNRLITPHALYLKLGNTANARLQAYRALFKAHIDEEKRMKIWNACQTGTPLGNDYFKEKIEQKLKCKIGQDRRGRPSKGL